MTAYDPSEWSDLFVASAGASAALAGLVFVAVSINIERILKFEGLPERALETVLLLMSVLLVSLVGLIPGQSAAALGAELLALGLLIGAFIVRLPTIRSDGEGEQASWLATRWGVRITAIAPLIVGGLSLLAESGGGLYWVVAGMVFAVIGAVASAWVLLVEILRCSRLRRRPRAKGRPAAGTARMARCADPTNAATPSSPATSVMSPVARWRS